MSSRLHAPGDAPPIEPVVWRQASQSTAGPSGDAPDPRAQIEEIERQSGERVRQAYAAGVRDGDAAGRAAAAAEVQPVMQRLARTMDDVAGLRARLRAEAEADLVQLALAIARRVLRREISLDPEALHGLILGALEKLQGQEIARARVHPAHVAALTACLAEGLHARSIEIVADPSREIGAVIFETPRGNLDAGVETQLQEIERGLADRLRRQS